jgi:hypothetical protein
MLGAGEGLARPPIVEDLMVVPLRNGRDIGIERDQVLVEQIVFPVAAVVVEGFGYMGLFLGDEIPPDLAVGELDLGRQHHIRIDVVARMDEEVRPVAQHGRIGAHAAARLVDAPALAGLIARPAERNRTAVARRGAKAAHHRLADDRRACEVLKPDTVEDVLAGRELLEQQLRRQIAVRQSIHEGPAANILEAVAGGDLDLHPGRPIAACPDHPGIDADVARLQAVSDKRSVGGAA